MTRPGRQEYATARQALEREFVARQIDQTLDALWKLRDRHETRRPSQLG